MERGAAHGGLRRYSPAQWGGGVAPRQLAWGVTRRRSQCCHCLVHEKACSCAVRHGSRTPWHLMHEAVAALTCSYAMACSYAQPYAMASHARGSGSTVMLVCPAVRHAWSTTAHAAYNVHSRGHAAAWKRQASGWASASSGERDSSMRLRWRASRGAAAATIWATARVCTHTPSKPSPAQLAALCSRNASYSQKADASCRREGGVGGGGGSCGDCCCGGGGGGCGGGCGCGGGGCGGGGDACGVTTCVTDAAALACACAHGAHEAATLRTLCTCEAGCEGVPDRA